MAAGKSVGPGFPASALGPTPARPDGHGWVPGNRGTPLIPFTAATRLANVPTFCSAVRTCLAIPCVAAVILGSLASTGARAGDDVEGVTAVASKVSGDYVRTKLPDGSFQPEYYAFGEGGKWAGEISDITVDKLKFLDVAHTIAYPLGTQKYFPSRDPKATKLLIMVYWGTTAVPAPTFNTVAVDQFQAAAENLAKYSSISPSGRNPVGGGPLADAAISQWSAALLMLNMQNRQNDQLDFKNAHMLGYDASDLIGTERANYVRGTAFGADRDDLYADIRENRYFVVLMAYDFQLMWRQRKHKLLWETRFSISERHNQFDEALPIMAQYASRYFGQDSRGLLRARVPEGRVDVGEPRSLGEVAAPSR